MNSTRRTEACALLAAAALASQTAGAQDQRPVDTYIEWLRDPSRQWLATAHLQRVPEAAIKRLLEPGRTAPGRERGMSPVLLTLAKIGEPAVPAIDGRLRTILRNAETEGSADAYGLIKALGAIGPAAVPSLMTVAETATGGLTYWALSSIMAMEPPQRAFGELSSPWDSWRPADDLLPRLEQAVVPLLSRIEKLLDRLLAESEPASSSLRGAAYLLARWGDPGRRARGLQVLEDLVRNGEYYEYESIRLLQRFNAPILGTLIRLKARSIPDGNDLKGHVLLKMAIGLHQLGEDCGPLVDEAIRWARPSDRMDAATFLGETQDLSNVPRLAALLDDRTKWSGRVVADVAHEALRRLTLQDLPPSSDAWRAWFVALDGTPRHRIVEQWVTTKRNQIADVPIWVANEWIDRVSATLDARVLGLLGDYLQRDDLYWRATGPGRGVSARGPGLPGRPAPPVVTLLFRMAREGVAGAIATLEACLDAADPEVRMVGAVALSEYEPRRAADSLARELDAEEGWPRRITAELLLTVGDSRGIPARIDQMERGALASEGIGDDELSQTIRHFACRDLRVHTQQPLPCNPAATGESLAAQVAAWRAWWQSAGPGFVIDRRAARLDTEEAQYTVRPVVLGRGVVR